MIAHAAIPSTSVITRTKQEGWLSPTERASVSAISLRHIIWLPQESHAGMSFGGWHLATSREPKARPLHANDAKTFLKHFSDCLFYFCSTCADSFIVRNPMTSQNSKNTLMYPSVDQLAAILLAQSSLEQAQHLEKRCVVELFPIAGCSFQNNHN